MHMPRIRFEVIRLLLLIGLLAIALGASSAVPALAQTSGTWTTTGSMNFPRQLHTATLLDNGLVLVAGGRENGVLIAKAELYDPATGKWTVTGALATPRWGHTATLLQNGEVLVAGGTDSANQLLAEAELYNPATGLWTATGSMTIARSNHGATLLQNGVVLVAGGATPSDLSGNTAELYNPTTGAWKATASMHNYHPLALRTLQDGRALKVDAGGGSSELYDPSKAQWTLTGPMYFNFSGGTNNTALLQNGDVLVYGNPSLTSYTSQFYNPIANTWSRTFGQTTILVGPLALLPNGKVLLGGGHTKYGGTTRISLLYDPSTNQWTSTGSMLQVGANVLTTLPDGQVLAVTNSDVELYTP